jgi:hypothetical protein
LKKIRQRPEAANTPRDLRLTDARPGRCGKNCQRQLEKNRLQLGEATEQRPIS